LASLLFPVPAIRVPAQRDFKILGTDPQSTAINDALETSPWYIRKLARWVGISTVQSSEFNPPMSESEPSVERLWPINNTTMARLDADHPPSPDEGMELAANVAKGKTTIADNLRRPGVLE